MARIRTIKPEFFFNETLADLDEETGLPVRLAYIGLWCQCDREGRFEWRPKRLKAQILPYDSTPLSRVLDALTTRGFVEKYDIDGVEFGVIPGFLEHQVVNNREKPSSLPDPSNHAALTRAPRVDDACPTPLGKCKAEGKGREGNKNKTPVDKSPGYAFAGNTIKLNLEDFESCRKQYPNLDLEAELSQLDLELKGKSGWFMAMHAKLRYRNNQSAPPPDPYADNRVAL